MVRPFGWLLLVVGLLGACGGLAPLAEPLTETIAVESVSFPGRLWDPFLPSSRSPVVVDGLLTIPATDEPVPAVIIVHGCGGVGAGEREWADELAAAGIASVVLDNFTARGVSDICSGAETINVASPIYDVYRTADWLAEHPYIDQDRIAVLGFSFGGRTALWASQVRFQEEYGGRPLRGYVAFYPSTCFIRLENETVVAGGPIRIFHGTADDWTPLAPCQEYIDRLSATGVDAALYTYEGAHHGFDRRELAWGVLHVSPGTPSPRSCEFVERAGRIFDADTGSLAGVSSTCVERGVSYGFDAAARAAAGADLLRFLEEIFD